MEDEYEAISDLRPVPEFQNFGQFKNAAAVMDNMVARATTKWTLLESKLFACAISQIDMIDENGFVYLRKTDLEKTLDIDVSNSGKIRAAMKSMAKKSDIELERKGAGKNQDEWAQGFLVIGATGSRTHLKVQFNTYYLPLLHYVKDRHYTRVEVAAVSGFNSKHGYNLYLYLKSRRDPKLIEDRYRINKQDIARVFQLKEGQYWRKYGTTDAKFDWTNFEARCLNPAIEDINNNIYCDIRNLSSKKEKIDGYVAGYEMGWTNGKDVPRLMTTFQPDCFEEQQAKDLMKKIASLDDIEIAKLSAALGSDWMGQVRYAADELREVQKLKEMPATLFRAFRAAINFIAENYEKFADLLGYKEAQKFLEAINATGKLLYSHGKIEDHEIAV